MQEELEWGRTEMSYWLINHGPNGHDRQNGLMSGFTRLSPHFRGIRPEILPSIHRARRARGRTDAY